MNPQSRSAIRMIQCSGDSPVEHQHFAELADHHVRRLQIAMDDGVRVGERNGIADAKEHAEPLADVPPGAHPAIQPIAAHQLHRVEEAAVGKFAEVMDGDNPGVFEAGDEPGLVRVAGRRSKIFSATSRSSAVSRAR
jgi:hypothetical protein